MAEDKDKQEKRYTTHEEFEAAIRRLGIPVRNTTATRPEDRKQPKRYSTHEEVIAAFRRAGVEIEDVTPRPEERERELFFFQGPKSFREPDEGEEGGEEVEG